jgi:hypothetical protein
VTPVYNAFLVVTASSITYQNAVVLFGLSDPGGSTGRTLVAQQGQVYYDWHDPGTGDRYYFDYAFVSGSNNTRMYLNNDETSVYTDPAPGDTLQVFFLKKR